MAFYDLEEQEQLAALKGWWKQWGMLLLLGIGLALAALAGYQIWLWYKNEQAIKAADLYASLHKHIRAGDVKQAREAAATLTQTYSGTGYAGLGSLVAARLNFDAGDLAAAKQNLQWVLDNMRDEDVKSVARFRLASVLLDQKAYDDALKLLDVKPEHPMAGLYADLRGDVLAAKGSVAEARAAYQTAYEKTDPKSPYRNLIQIKIDALGVPKS
jgi:predicted negative regulator of RcsB-dependent stress response